jgi:hypothetical protein
MAGTVIADNLQAASTSTLVIKNGVANTPPTIQDSAGTEIGTFCRAWVNFDGTGTFSPNPSTTKIRASFNVSSITDNGTGDYTVNFTNAMPDINYSFAGNSSQDAGTGTGGAFVVNQGATTPTTSAFNLRVHRSAVAYADAAYVSIAFFR